jgi:hypothetical protein
MKQYAQLAVSLLIVSACSSGDHSIPTAPNDGASFARQTGPSISVTSLPSLGGFSTARAINDDQVIVGTSNGLPVKWTLNASGQWIVESLQAAGGEAEDITESGLIVGSSGGSVILWSPGPPGTPGMVSETVGTGVAAAMNESKVVVGRDNSVTGASVAHAWVWSGTDWVAHVLVGMAEAPDGYAEPTDINDDRVIVGFAADASGSTHAVKWLPTTGGWEAAVPLDNDAATNFGGAGAIVGPDIVGNIIRCVVSSCTHDPRYWSLTGQGNASLGSANAWAEGLNAQRSAVGTFLYRGTHAFVWTLTDKTIRDLGAPKGYQSANAYDINNPNTIHASQAVGEAQTRNGKRTAVLWTIP